MASDSTPLAIAKDGDAASQCEVDKNERTDIGGETGYRLKLRVLK